MSLCDEETLTLHILGPGKGQAVFERCTLTTHKSEGHCQSFNDLVSLHIVCLYVVERKALVYL